jgi:tripartite-type tricarboxylate transporter receptor subunit TctC
MKMRKRIGNWRVLALATAFVPVLGLHDVSAAEKGKAYFNGKTVEWIVATAPGGGHDFWGRLVSNSMQDFLPGSKFVVKNRPGAGHIIGANLVYNAKPNGLTLGNYTTGLAYSQLINTRGIRFDLAKMSWIGKVSSERRVMSVAANSPIKTFADVLNAKRALKFSASGVGSGSYTDSFMIGEALNIPFRIITGYSGSQAALGMLRGELDVLMGGEDSAEAYARAGQIRTIMMIGGTKPGIVNGADYAKTPLAKSVVRLMESMGNLSRIISGPPNIPADRLGALRTAFRQAMASKKLNDAAKRAQRGLEPAYGEEVQKMVVDLMVQPPEIVAMLKKLSTLKDDLLAHSGPVTQIKKGGRQIYIKRAGQEVFAKVSGSRTKVTLNGKAAKRKAIKVGMTCTFKYPRANSEAKNIDCKN